MAAVYQNEDDASVWSDLASNLRDVENLIANEPYYQPYRSFARDLFRPAALRIGWDARPGEGHLDALLRSTVLSQAGGYGDTEVLEEARGRFSRYLQDPTSLHPDLRGLVYSLAAQTGDRDTYDQLWELAKDTELQEEHIRLLLSLARFASPDLLQETLERSLSDDVRFQDTITVVTAVAGNLHGRELAWSFVKDRWEEFDRRYGGGGFGLMRLVSICGGLRRTPASWRMWSHSFRSIRCRRRKGPSVSPWSAYSLTFAGWSGTELSWARGSAGSRYYRSSFRD